MGKEYWRSLDELADTPEFRALVEKEFPGLAEELLSPQTRRGRGTWKLVVHEAVSPGPNLLPQLLR